MRSQWRQRLAALAAATTVALAGVPACLTLTAGMASQSGVAAMSFYCPAGTHWDNTLHHCV
jgi:hypothetical protein